ncbi:TIGR04190 family B12-binding domain/radical SAM domain protein [Candidatus Bathyarchaeota archaeon]|nr:TIGR04190 family B12-binding domain/radical SAM domain protein [Candidatus Bathyarchaeota archaeon]
MGRPDLVLLHAPSVYDFRRRFAMYGPISDVIPSTPIFEMYPLGFVSIVGYLEARGYNTRIVNLAVKMLRDREFDVERTISKLDPLAFGIDLHWMVHASGSLDIAEIVKRYHPETPIIVGGLSATYYHEEIIKGFPQVDYILRGDSTERPLLHLLEDIEAGREPEGVENLTWRSGDGRIRVNPLSHVPESLDDLGLDYGDMVSLVVRHRSLEENLPYEGFMDYPFTALLTCKGCLYNCVTCGGSRFAYRKFFNRDKPAFKSPERLLEEVLAVSEYFDAPIFLLGDLRQGGERYAEMILRGIGREGVDNTLTLELFTPASRSFLEAIAGSCERFALEISPETHDDAVRRLQGRPYSSSELERTVEEAMRLDCEKFDVFFMVGIPGQTVDSTLESVEYSKRLLERFGRGGRLHTFIAPMAPFLDPGSLAFEYPARHGYRRLYSSLREHRDALLQPCWKLILNYETRWMTRDQIAEATYKAMMRMNEVKMEMGVIEREVGERVAEGLALAWEIMCRIDAVNTLDEEDSKKAYEELRLKVERSAKWTEYSKRELRPQARAGVRLRGALKHLIRTHLRRR